MDTEAPYVISIPDLPFKNMYITHYDIKLLNSVVTFENLIYGGRHIHLLSL